LTGAVGDGVDPAVLQSVDEPSLDLGGDVGVGVLDAVAEDVAEASGLGRSPPLEMMTYQPLWRHRG
jgi:hypothetical protein